MINEFMHKAFLVASKVPNTLVYWADFWDLVGTGQMLADIFFGYEARYQQSLRWQIYSVIPGFKAILSNKDN